MKVVMENKSGYIRPLCSAHPAPTLDVSWPIENQLYLPNKRAGAENDNDCKRGRLVWTRQMNALIIIKKK